MIENINFKFSNISKNLKEDYFHKNDLKNAHFKFLKCLENNELDCISIVKSRSQLKIINQNSRIFSKCKDIIIVGTGGSSLGSKMIGSIFENKKVFIHYLENVEPSTNKKILKTINPESAGLIIISKSGETIETLSQFFFLLNKFIKDNNLLKKRTLIITENKKSTLKSIQENLGLNFAEHSKTIGGRYSVFSIVGLLPSKLQHIDIEKILLGGEEVLNQLTKVNDPYLFPPTQAALIHSKLLKNNFNLNIFFTYLDSFQNFSLWLRQLWAESIGKNGVGSTLLNASGTVDQHSQLQLYLDGPRDKFINVVGMNRPERSPKLSCIINGKNFSNNLHEKTMGQLYFAEMQATYKTIEKKKIPLRLIEFSKIDEKTVGSLIMCFFLETIYTCFLLNINPFDQPAVEEGKKLAVKYLKNAKD